MPRTGDVMILKSDKTLQPVQCFSAAIQTLGAFFALFRPPPLFALSLFVCRPSRAPPFHPLFVTNKPISLTPSRTTTNNTNTYNNN